MELECTKRIPYKEGPMENSLWAGSLFFFLLFLGGTGVWAHSLMLAVYCFSLTSSPFCSGCFGDRVSLFAQAFSGQWSSYFMLSPVARINRWACRHTQLFLLRWDFPNYWPGLASNYSPPTHSSSSS
jgi:hypothetical protein